MVKCIIMEQTITSANVTPTSSVIVQGSTPQEHQQQKQSPQEEAPVASTLLSLSHTDSSTSITSLAREGVGHSSGGILPSRGPPLLPTQSSGINTQGKSFGRNLNGTSEFGFLFLLVNY